MPDGMANIGIADPVFKGGLIKFNDVFKHYAAAYRRVFRRFVRWSCRTSGTLEYSGKDGEKQTPVGGYGTLHKYTVRV
jgi:hypothetical protein